MQIQFCPQTILPYPSPLEADAASDTRPEPRCRHGENAATETREIPLWHRNTPFTWPDMGFYTLTLQALPQGSLSDEQIRQIGTLVSELNWYTKKPVEHMLFIACGGGTGPTGGLVTLPSEWSRFDDLLQTIAHEIGHEIFNQRMRDPFWAALQVVAFYDHAEEIVDDSNYGFLPEGAGHVLDDYIDFEGQHYPGTELDGSAVQAYVHGEQFKKYINSAQTPKFMQRFGQTVYLYLKERVFDGRTFTCSAPDPWENKPFHDIFAQLLEETEARIAAIIEDGTMEELYERDIPRHTEVLCRVDADCGLRTRLCDKFLAETGTAGPYCEK